MGKLEAIAGILGLGIFGFILYKFAIGEWKLPGLPEFKIGPYGVPEIPGLPGYVVVPPELPYWMKRLPELETQVGEMAKTVRRRKLEVGALAIETGKIIMPRGYEPPRVPGLPGLTGRERGVVAEAMRYEALAKYYGKSSYGSHNLGLGSR